MNKYFIYFFTISILISCRKEITLNLANASEKVVVQGSIEPGFPPYVILTRNQGYFDPIDSNTYNDLFIYEDEISKIKVFKLDKTEIIDSIDLSYEMIGDIAVFTNLDFTTIDWSTFSQEGFRYNLEFNWNETLITSTTTIPFSNPLDSIWVEETDNIQDNKYNYDINAILTDPDSIGNNFLVRSKRLEHWVIDTLTTNGTPRNENDNSLLLVDCGPDILVNGESFETRFPRPSGQGGFPSGSYKSSRYKTFINTNPYNKDSILLPEDVVLIKFSQVDLAAMKFWRGVVRNSTAGNNPFSEPMNLSSNINGGLGSWTGYGSRYYLVPIIKDTTITTEYNPEIYEIF